jgi:hypothetical protein
LIRVFDVATGAELAVFDVLDAASAAGGASVYPIEVVETGRETGIAVFTVAADESVSVSIRDPRTGAELYAPAFSGAPSSYQNASSVLSNVASDGTNELAVAFEDTATGLHRVEIRDMETGSAVVPEPPPAPPPRKGGGMIGLWLLSLLLLIAAVRQRRLGRR